MKINKKLEIEKYLTVNELSSGDVFVFCNDTIPCLLAIDDFGAYYVVELDCGNVYAVTDDVIKLPIRKLDAELVFND